MPKASSSFIFGCNSTCSNLTDHKHLSLSPLSSKSIILFFKLQSGIYVPKVYECEQAECPQRALRLIVAHGNSDSKHQQQRTSRSLAELTADKEVFSW
jgi:hypothetical protein